MSRRRKPRTPYFVSVELLPDGEVKLITDEGDEYHVQMHPKEAWPILSRLARWRDQFDYGRPKSSAGTPPRPDGGPPRLVTRNGRPAA
jgi:hypothetical protein